MTDQQTIDAAKHLVEERFGNLDVLVNNAAILYDSWQRAENANLETVREAFETNTLGAWRMCQAFTTLLRKSKHARIVNVSSESGSLSVMGGGTPADCPLLHEFMAIDMDERWINRSPKAML